MRILTFIAALAAGAALAGCGGGDSPAAEPPAQSVPQSSGLGAGPAISVDEALASRSEEPLLVMGNLLAHGGEVRLCAALAESFPPQCGGLSLHVDGLDLAEVDELVTEGNVSWTDRPIELVGIVKRDTLGKDNILAMAENVQQ